MGEWQRRRREYSSRLPASLEPNSGLNRRTLRSWAKPKSRVECSTEWTTQVPHYLVFSWQNNSNIENWGGKGIHDFNILTNLIYLCFPQAFMNTEYSLFSVLWFFKNTLDFFPNSYCWAGGIKGDREAPTKWWQTPHLVAPTSELSHHQQTPPTPGHVIRGETGPMQETWAYFIQTPYKGMDSYCPRPFHQ